MSEPREMELTRRNVLKRGAGATGALFVGGTAIAGNAAAKKGGTGFFPEDAVEGDTFNVGSRVETYTDIAVECEANNNVRSIYTKYEIYGEDVRDGTFAWVKGKHPLNVGDTFKVNKVRDCGTTTVADWPFEPGQHSAEKITFSPAKP